MMKSTTGKILSGALGFMILCLIAAGCGAQKENTVQGATSEEDGMSAEDQFSTRENENIIQEEPEQTEQWEGDNVVFAGKSLSILGDSLSTFYEWIPEGYGFFFPFDGEVKDVEQTWWKMLQNDLGLVLYGNSSSAGSTCAGDSLSQDDPKYGCSDYRIADLTGDGGARPDIIIVYMGTNDLLTAVPIGENDGTEPVEEGMIETFSDGYCMILDKLEAQYPSSQVFCCTLAVVGKRNGNIYEAFENRIGLTYEDYNDQIELIAGPRGSPLIELQYCGITLENMADYVSDGIHFNPEGMKLIRDEMKNAVIDFGADGL